MSIVSVILILSTSSEDEKAIEMNTVSATIILWVYTNLI